MKHILRSILLSCSFLCAAVSSSPAEQLVLTQHTVAMDANSDLIWFANDTAPQREWQDSIIPLVPFYESWNGYLIYFGTSCPQTLTPSTLAELNNYTQFETGLPRIGLIARGDDCSWSTKVTHAKVTASNLSETIDGVILFDNQSIASNTQPENNIISFDIPIVFVNRSIGMALLDSVKVANTASAMTNLTVLSQVIVHYELLDDGGGRGGGGLLESTKARPYRSAEPTSRWILAGQWIINSVAVAFIIGLVAYAYRRLKSQKSEPTQRQNSQQDFSTVGSPAGSILAPGSADQTSTRETEEQGLGWEKLEQYPKIEYDSRLIRNSTCAICLEHFHQKSPKLLRMLNCNHGFCVSCIDPWLSSKSKSCPLCKQDCTPQDRNPPS